MKARLIIDLEINLQGELAENVLHRLGDCASFLDGEGFFTGTTDATVDGWTFKVERLTPQTALPCGCVHHGILAGCPIHGQQASQAPKTIQEHNAFPEGRFTAKR